MFYNGLFPSFRPSSAINLGLLTPSKTSPPLLLVSSHWEKAPKVSIIISLFSFLQIPFLVKPCLALWTIMNCTYFVFFFFFFSPSEATQVHTVRGREWGKRWNQQGSLGQGDLPSGTLCLHHTPTTHLTYKLTRLSPKPVVHQQTEINIMTCKLPLFYEIHLSFRI